MITFCSTAETFTPLHHKNNMIRFQRMVEYITNGLVDSVHDYGTSMERRANNT